MSKPKRLVNGAVLGSGFAAQYTAPLDTTAIITAAVLTNTTANPRIVDVCLVPSGESPGDGNIILKQRTIGPNESMFIFTATNQVLETGASLQCKADGAVTLVASGIEV